MTNAEVPSSLSRGIRRFARAGFAARGIIYIVIGLLSAALAAGWAAGETAGSRGALHRIAE